MSATELGTEREVAVLVTSNGRQEMQLGRNSYNFNHLTGGADGTRTRDPRRDRPVRASATMSEEE
jgi:hypothetical protein